MVAKPHATEFVRFPSVSLTPKGVQVSGFGSLDPTNLDNLTGKYPGGFGTTSTRADSISTARPYST